MSDLRFEITSPVVRVIMADGATFELQTGTADLVDYEEHARKHNLPPMGDPAGINGWFTYIAWCAAKRERMIPDGLPYAAFRKQAIQVLPGMADDTDTTEGTAPGDPSRPGPGPG